MNEPQDIAPDRTPNRAALAWATWRATVAMVAALLVLRVLYLVWLCPWELAADEAYYWDWGRRLQWSYYSKGPGVAWTIALSTRLLGDAEWTIRLPAALASAIAALALARLARSAADGDERVGFFAAAIFSLIPIYYAFGQIMTIDGPYLAFWILAAWAAWRVFRGLRTGRSPLAPWLALGGALGAGFLFKYTILLLLPGLLAYAIVDRRQLRLPRRATVGVVLCAAVFLAAISPVLIWNHQHGWPTLGELLGHVRSSSRGVDEAKGYQPRWTLELLGAQILAIGPALVLMGWAIIAGVRTPGRGAERRSVDRMMICFAAPVLLFYFLLSFRTDVEGNWPIAGYATLAVLAARWTVEKLTLRRQAAPPRRRPLRWAFGWWCWTVAYGVLAAVLISWPQLLAAAPGIGRYMPMHRISGHRARAAEVQTAIERLRRQTGREPVIATGHYGEAALLAFYLPGRPVTRCARGLTDKPTSYDFFEDASFTDPDLIGRTFLLLPGYPQAWEGKVRFDRMEYWPAPLDVLVGFEYRGPTEAARKNARN